MNKQDNLVSDQEKFTEALLKGSYSKALSIAHKYALSHDMIKIFYEQVVKPSLYRIGELWEYNQITVAAEHLATSLSESVMNELYENIISEDRVSKCVLLGCVETEHHQVGIKMIADIFEMNGWDTFFLGANMPTSELIKFSLEKKPDLIALSLSVYSHIPYLEKMIIDIQQKLPCTPLLVGGQAFNNGGDEIMSKYQNVTFLREFQEIEKFIINFQPL